MNGELRDPWAVAAWPGMGSVALLACSYLTQQLAISAPADLKTDDLFPVQQIEVHNGIASVSPRPRTHLCEWRNPGGEHDLIFVLGEAQPEHGGYQLCRRLVEHGEKRGVKTFFTFAAMATQLQLGGRPRVFAAATDAQALEQVRPLGVEVLESGQISGLNGVLLAAAAERGLHGVCLLGELPYFAIGVPNPRAAEAVLQRFTRLVGIEIDCAAIERQAKVVERQLEELLQQMQTSDEAGSESEGVGSEEESEESEGSSGTQEQLKKPERKELPASARARIEALFTAARRDHEKAMELKRELDRLGVFKEFENRFLDLFRRGA